MMSKGRFFVRHWKRRWHAHSESLQGLTHSSHVNSACPTGPYRALQPQVRTRPVIPAPVHSGQGDFGKLSVVVGSECLKSSNLAPDPEFAACCG